MDIKSLEINKSVNELKGWVDTIRHHGGLLFIELRDYESRIQLVTDSPENYPEIKSEYLISVSGDVVKREKNNINTNIEHGDIEIKISKLVIISPSKVLPFQIENNIDVDEQIRLKYRYLDLRRPEMQNNVKMRSKIFKSIRNTMNKLNIDEIDTPTLIKSTPEGARDFIVPSRKNSGKFYALPQSPQMYKQLFMMSGFSSYYQIARCYRDEDSRKDRQPEFTQFDLEIPFAEPENIQNVIEQLITNIFNDCLGINVADSFIRMTYDECILKYGSDKPDLRNPLIIDDLTQVFKDTNIDFIKKLLNNGASVSAIYIDDIYKRSEIEKIDFDIKELGSTGLGYFIVNEDKISSPLAKLLTEKEKKALKDFANNKGTIFFQVGDPMVVNKYLGELFTLNVSSEDNFAFLWIDEFPYFEIENDTLVPSHHPFTSPLDPDTFVLNTDTAKACHYDLVLNGVELGSGSKRISDPNIQIEVLKKWGLSDDEIDKRFGWFIEALSYGTPPHAGIALGLDRLVATILNLDSIRDAIPFPKTQTGYDPLSDAPTSLGNETLSEYNIRMIEDTE